MGKLFEGFEILCTDYDHLLEERRDIIQERTLYKGGHYLRKYGMYVVINSTTIVVVIS